MCVQSLFMDQRHRAWSHFDASSLGRGSTTDEGTGMMSPAELLEMQETLIRRVRVLLNFRLLAFFLSLRKTVFGKFASIFTGIIVICL